MTYDDMLASSLYELAATRVAFLQYKPVPGLNSMQEFDRKEICKHLDEACALLRRLRESTTPAQKLTEIIV